MPRILPVLLIAFTGIASADDFPDPVNTQAAGEHPPSPREMLELFELPEGFQSAEFVKEHGFLDFISHRKDLKKKINLYIDLIQNNPIRK